MLSLANYQSANEITIVHLLRVKCLPILLHELEACDLNRAQLASFGFVVVRTAVKVFRSTNRTLVLDCINCWIKVAQ
jgi:hypothetical protein